MLTNLGENPKKFASPPFPPFWRENQTRPSPFLSRNLNTHQETTMKNRINYHYDDIDKNDDYHPCL